MTIAGSKGGLYKSANDPKGFDIDIVRQWQSVGTKTLTGNQLYESLIPTARPMQLEIGIGNTCGLECKHCFLGYESGAMNEALVPLDRLLNISTEFVEQLGTRIICVTDRDALTPIRSIPLFVVLAKLREKYKDLKFGGITNGLAIHTYIDALKSINLDYLDISMDGLKKEHDAIRGQGMFEKTLTNLRLVLNHRVTERAIISMTLTKFNDESLIQLIKKLIVEEGVQWFDIGPLMAVKMQAHQLGERDTVIFLDRLRNELQSIKAVKPVNIIFEICAYCAAFIPGLIDHGWLIPEKIHQDQYGHLYQDIQVNDAITITLKPELIPEYWRHTLRITADGFVVGGCEPITQQDYNRMSVGNIKEFSAKNLYQKSIAPGSIFHNMMLAYDQSECRDKFCFQHCLGGDSLLAKAVYDVYNRKDPNCTWNDYIYQTTIPMQKKIVHLPVYAHA